MNKANLLMDNYIKQTQLIKRQIVPREYFCINCKFSTSHELI